MRKIHFETKQNVGMWFDSKLQTHSHLTLKHISQMRESLVIASDNGKVNGGHGNAERQNQNSNSLEPSISIPIPNAKCKMNGIIFKHSIECMIVCRFMGNVGHFLLGCIIFNLQNVPHCEYMYKYGVKHPSNRD